MIKLFTHSDLDGISCYIVAAAFFGEENISVEYCEYDNVNEKILKFLDNEKPTDYEEIFITDISVNEEVAEKLDLLSRGNVCKVTLLDHHQTALWLNKYGWAHVRVTYPSIEIQKSEDGDWAQIPIEEKESGTSFLLEVLEDRRILPKHIPDIYDLEKYAEQVRRYDTWDWHNKYKDVYPKELNDLFKIYGRDAYIDKILSMIREEGGQDYFINETDRIVLDLQQKEIDRYVYKKNKSLRTVYYSDHTFDYTLGIVFAESHISELGNRLGELNPECDLIMMINMSTNSASLRTVKENIDVAEFAKHFRGGGHRAAAGMSIPEQLSSDVINSLLC